MNCTTASCGTPWQSAHAVPFSSSGGTFREIQTIRHLLIVIGDSASAVSRSSIRIGSRRAAPTTTPLDATSTDMLRRTVAPALEVSTPIVRAAAQNGADRKNIRNSESRLPFNRSTDLL
jgi:hypothetical protein